MIIKLGSRPVFMSLSKRTSVEWVFVNYTKRFDKTLFFKRWSIGGFPLCVQGKADPLRSQRPHLHEMRPMDKGFLMSGNDESRGPTTFCQIIGCRSAWQKIRHWKRRGLSPITGRRFGVQTTKRDISREAIWVLLDCSPLLSLGIICLTNVQFSNISI